MNLKILNLAKILLKFNIKRLQRIVDFIIYELSFNDKLESNLIQILNPFLNKISQLSS